MDKDLREKIDFIYGNIQWKILGELIRNMNAFFSVEDTLLDKLEKRVTELEKKVNKEPGGRNIDSSWF